MEAVRTPYEAHDASASDGLLPSPSRPVRRVQTMLWSTHSQCGPNCCARCRRGPATRRRRSGSSETGPCATRVHCARPPPREGKFETQVAASRFEGVKFPQSGALAPKGGFTSNIAGARRGTILALPNAGAAPKNYARSFAPSLGTSSDATNAKSTLQAFWSVVDGGGATDVTVEQKDSTRTVVRYLAPTVKRGVQKQVITADRLACACASSSEGPDSLVVAERWAQASVVDGADAALTSLSGTYTAWHRYDRVDGGVRETLRVAAFDDSAAADDDTRPAAVYDYSFFLRRAPAR